MRHRVDERYSRHFSSAPPLAAFPANVRSRTLFPGWVGEVIDPRSAAAFDSETTSSIGIRFDRQLAEARGCWLSFHGSPLLEAPEIRSTSTATLSSELLRQLRTIEQNESLGELRDIVATELTAITSRLCHQLISEATESAEDILAIGIHGAGVWDSGEVARRSYAECLLAADLAEQFGKTIVDNFPGRDLAQGGFGGPVESHGLWFLLSDRSPFPGLRWRALLDISPHATHISLVGPLDDRTRLESFSSVTVCVGSRLLTELVARSSADEPKPVDYRKIGESGRVLIELEEIWRATAGDNHGWKPDGVSALPLIYALEKSIYDKAGLPDLLATANHYIANQVVLHVRHRVSPAYPIGELLVMGDGSKHSLVMNWLKELLPAVKIRHLTELGQDRTILAASIAALTLLHVWQIPVPSTNRSEVPRVLGRITPGSPSNWQRVLHAMTSNAPWLLPLREAI